MLDMLNFYIWIVLHLSIANSWENWQGTPCTAILVFWSVVHHLSCCTGLYFRSGWGGIHFWSKQSKVVTTFCWFNFLTEICQNVCLSLSFGETCKWQTGKEFGKWTNWQRESVLYLSNYICFNCVLDSL